MNNKIAIHSGAIPAVLISLSVLFLSINFAENFRDYFFSFYAALGIILAYIIVNIKKFTTSFKMLLAAYSFGMIIFMISLI
ncbi:hypothetical protein ACVLVH_004520 [Kluyvera sp. 1366]